MEIFIALFIVILGFLGLELINGVSIVFKFIADDTTWIAAVGAILMFGSMLIYMFLS
mgnify:CR=1 FL=1